MEPSKRLPRCLLGSPKFKWRVKSAETLHPEKHVFSQTHHVKDIMSHSYHSRCCSMRKTLVGQTECKQSLYTSVCSANCLRILFGIRCKRSIIWYNRTETQDGGHLGGPRRCHHFLALPSASSQTRLLFASTAFRIEC